MSAIRLAIRFILLGAYFALSPLSAQVRIEVTSVPQLMLPQEGLYIVGSFNDWNPGEKEYKLQRGDNGNLFIIIPAEFGDFKYKFTQGSWTVVEGNAEGLSIADREYIAAKEENPRLVKVSIEGWEKRVFYRFVVTGVPENTPHDAALYITGNFNNWDPGNESFKLQRQTNGEFRVSIFSDLKQIEYKFTRGNWSSVEGTATGKARRNRVIDRGYKGKIDNIPIEIESWEDLTGTFTYFSFFDLLLLFSAFQGFLLVITIPTIQDYNRKANQLLVLLLAITSVLMLVRVLSGYRELAQAFPKMQLFPDFLWLAYAPIFYFYVEKLLFNANRLAPRGWLHFIPLAVQFVAYMPLFLMDNVDLKVRIFNGDPVFILVFRIFGGIAFLYNCYYWWVLWKEINDYRAQAESSFSYEENLHFLNTVMIIKAFCLSIWFIASLVTIYGWILGKDYDTLISSISSVIWLIFSTIPHFLGYFAIHQPEVFKMPRTVSRFVVDSPVMVPVLKEPSVLDSKQEEHDETLEDIKSKLEAYMEEEKPFTNPKLTLNELATMMKVQAHVLSRVINEGYEKNFFDFINSYRVEEFKLRVDDPRYRHYTLLSIAFEVGFNSKTAFNRSFKKLTNLSPSAYYSQVKAL